MTQVALAQAIGVAQPTLSNLEKGRNADTSFLPEIERATGFLARWLRTGRGPQQIVDNTGGWFTVPLYDVAASMGGGLAVPEHVELVRAVSVDLNALRKFASFSSPDNLSFITGYGSSMEPTFFDGDVLLIDQGVGDVKFDAIYALERGTELFIKRLQRKVDGSLLMISDNKLYEPQVISPSEMDSFRVRGRVVLVWNTKRV